MDSSIRTEKFCEVKKSMCSDDPQVLDLDCQKLTRLAFFDSEIHKGVEDQARVARLQGMMGPVSASVFSAT